MRKIHYPFLCVMLLFSLINSVAQQPTIENAKTLKKDSVVRKNFEDSIKIIHSPRKAAIRSAIIPGWGQFYNKKYWKIPIVYGALGATAGIFFYNLKNYRNTRFAYAAKYKASLPAPNNDSTDYRNIRPELLPLSLESLRFYRNEFRRDIDYSVVIFLLLWGLNVVDATVDAHLKGFDVGPDLSLQIKPGYSPMANTSGISIVMKIR
jgi:Family of unknown function (DUF5683)